MTGPGERGQPRARSRRWRRGRAAIRLCDEAEADAKAGTLALPKTPKGKSALEIVKDDALLRARHSSVNSEPVQQGLLARMNE